MATKHLVLYKVLLKSTQSNFDGADTEEARASHASSQNDGAYGKYNTGASHTFKEARKPNPDEKKDYQAIKSVVNKDVKELKKIIEKRLKIKRMQIVINITEDFVRNSFVFILKSSLACFIKGQESQELDVAFQLLVDCSGSMYNKMEETKKSVVLFHEALKSLKSRTLLADFGKML